MINKHNNRFDEKDHKLVAIWASDCAEHVLPSFEKVYPEDDRPRKAIEAVRAWVQGDLQMVEARKAAFASHAAARDANNIAAKAAARSAGHAAATAHVADHARHAAAYAVKAVIATGNKDYITTEREWQYRRLPEHLRFLVFPNSSYDPIQKDDSKSE